ncbi:MAG: hypothetical protein V4525_05385 [Pseudomonadota bacterium]
MGKTKEIFAEQLEVEKLIAFERAEAAYFAVPDALHENLGIARSLQESHKLIQEKNVELHAQLMTLQNDFKEQTSSRAKFKERAIGFILGCLASVLASIIWLKMGHYWSVFQ